jgi:hypothetical protein
MIGIGRTLILDPDPAIEDLDHVER